MFVISVYLMVELNNRNALMRQYSRMVSCSYIALMGIFPQLFLSWQVMAVQLCFIAILSLLFATYQRRSALGHKYWAYLFLGIACAIWPPMLYLMPAFWIVEAFFLMSFSIKSFSASIFGVLTPLWIALPYIIYAGIYDDVIALSAQLLPGDALIQGFNSPELLLATDLPLDKIPYLTSYALLTLLLITGIVHCLRNIYQDKIQVRMLYNAFLLVVAFAYLAMLATIILNFENRDSVLYLLSIVVVCTSPLVAHYITFTNTRITNASVVIFILLLLAAGAYNFLFTDFVFTNIQSAIDLLINKITI